MSVSVEVRIPGALVIASDTLITRTAAALGEWGPDELAGRREYGHKVYPVGRHPIVVVSMGMGRAGDVDVGERIAALCQDIAGDKDRLALSDVSLPLEELVSAIWDRQWPDGPPIIDNGPATHRLMVLGFEDAGPWAHAVTCELPHSRSWEPWRSTGAMVSWEGQRDTLNRLFGGFSTDNLEKLEERGVPAATIMAWLTTDAGSNLPLTLAGIDVEQATDLAAFGVQVTIGAQAFGPAPARCGGPIDIAVVRADGVEWQVRQPWVTQRPLRSLGPPLSLIGYPCPRP